MRNASGASCASASDASEASASRTATAIAHPNIALSKYWGKLRSRDGVETPGNIPAVPSLSVTLDGLETKTTVSFDEALAADALVLNGANANETACARATDLLDRVRAASGIKARARVVSTNDFPTASGLASSASGFAALAMAAVRAAELDWSAEHVADLARRSSASAARSVFSGFVELDGGPGKTGAARALATPSAFDLRILVCVTTEEAKSVASTDGMTKTQKESPYWAAWLEEAPRLHAELRTALLAGDFDAVGARAERSALAMHACAMGAGIVYMTGATLAALAETRALRKDGISAWATIDAGPHLKCIVRAKDVAAAHERLARVPGVLRILTAKPGAGARIVDASSVTGGGGT